MLRGAGPAPGTGLWVIRGTFVNLSGNFSVNTLRSRIFLTSVSIKVILRSGFKVNVLSAQKSKGVLGYEVGYEVVTKGNLVSSNL